MRPPIFKEVRILLNPEPNLRGEFMEMGRRTTIFLFGLPVKRTISIKKFQKV